MDISRVLQTGDLSRSIVTVAAIAAVVTTGAIAFTAGRDQPHQPVSAVMACEGDRVDPGVKGDGPGDTVIEGCREPSATSAPPY
jgi:hypothetical protein